MTQIIMRGVPDNVRIELNRIKIEKRLKNMSQVVEYLLKEVKK